MDKGNVFAESCCFQSSCCSQRLLLPGLHPGLIPPHHHSHCTLSEVLSGYWCAKGSLSIPLPGDCLPRCLSGGGIWRCENTRLNMKAFCENMSKENAKDPVAGVKRSTGLRRPSADGSFKLRYSIAVPTLPAVIEEEVHPFGHSQQLARALLAELRCKMEPTVQLEPNCC